MRILLRHDVRPGHFAHLLLFGGRVLSRGPPGAGGRATVVRCGRRVADEIAALPPANSLLDR
jgi:hypothetical protein